MDQVGIQSGLQVTMPTNHYYSKNKRRNSLTIYDGYVGPGSVPVS